MAEETATNADREAMDLMIKGFMTARMLRLVADLGVADHIPPDGTIGIDQLAGHCNVQAGQLIRVLRALASLGVFGVGADGHVRHTARSKLLRTDAAQSMHHSARFWAAPGSWAAWGALDTAMTGGNPHRAAWNEGRFDYLRSHPAEARGFDAMMASFPDNRHAAIAASYDFSTATRIVDIGGGNGAALRHILGRFAQPHGVVFDRDDVVQAIAPADLMGGRITAQGGSFFETVPTGADRYLIIRVLHDWSDEDCVRILKVCRAAMRPDALLLIGEQLLEADPSKGHPAGYLVDMQMMAMFGDARERTIEEFAALLAQSGFALQRAIPTHSMVSIIEAKST